ncbi:hypothetical protein F5888DRAFT_1907091 [Russula emetica]|nr:hypothetical protein F5888DRAFT_1907091 [Russula emetica]
MTIKQPFDIYQEQLSSIYHGLALWKPNPVLYDRVSIGDVGYVNNEGAFIRLFNVTLPWDDESNKTLALGDPLYYDPLRPDSFTIRSETFGKSDHYSRRVSREDNAHSILAKTPDQAEGVTYECRGHGALLSLPCGGRRQAVIQTKIFEKYAGEHVADWFHWSKVRGLPIEHMEDLVLIHGCTLVTSWAAAAFDDLATGAQVSLAGRTLKNGGASFVWSNICGTVERHDSQLESLDERISSAPLNQCVFIKCTRAKPNKFWAKIFRAPAPAFNLPGAALFSSAGVAYDARTLTESISQTTPDTPPGKNSDSSLPRRSSGSNSSLHLGSPPAKPPPSRTRTTSPKRNSSMAPRQPSRSDDVLRDVEERGARLADEERVLHAERMRMRGIGLPLR